jgi:alkyl hydroperoxide reductase subunit F
MLDANLKAQLKSYLERVTQPIEIVASLDDGAKSREMHDLLKKLTASPARLPCWKTATMRANRRSR